MAVWITIAFIEGLFRPAYSLVMSNPTILRLKRNIKSKAKQVVSAAAQTSGSSSTAERVDDQDQPHEDGRSVLNENVLRATLESFGDVRKDMVGLMRRFVTVAVFGVSVPPLLLVAPLFIWIQGCASRRQHRDIHRTFRHTEALADSETAFTFRIVSAVLVQQPVRYIQGAVHLLVWLVTGFVMFDLEFETGNRSNHIVLYSHLVIMYQVLYYSL